MRDIDAKTRDVTIRGVKTRLGFRVILAAVAMLGAPATASEVYDISTPFDTQQLAEAPNRLTIRFTEPVRFDAASLVDAAGRPVEIRYGLPEDDTDEVSIRIPEPLPPGSYTMRWMVYVTAHRHLDDGESASRCCRRHSAAHRPASVASSSRAPGRSGAAASSRRSRRAAAGGSDRCSACAMASNGS